MPTIVKVFVQYAHLVLNQLLINLLVSVRTVFNTLI